MSVNLRSFEGFVPADLTIFYQSPGSRDTIIEAVKNHLGDMLVFVDLEDKQHGYFALAVPSVARIREIESWAKTCDGVRKCSCGDTSRYFILSSILRRASEKQNRAADQSISLADSCRWNVH